MLDAATRAAIPPASPLPAHELLLLFDVRGGMKICGLSHLAAPWGVGWRGGMLQSQPPTLDASAGSSEQQKQGQALYKGVLVLVWFFLCFFLTANPLSAV